MGNRVLFVNNGLSTGGSERVMCVLANEIYARGCEVSMVNLNPYVPASYELMKEIEVLPCEYGNRRGMRYLLFVFRFLRKEIMNGNYDVVVSFLRDINILTMIASMGSRKKIVISDRNDPISLIYKHPIFELLKVFLYPFASSVVLQTEDAKKLYSYNIRKRVVVIPNPIMNDIPYAVSIGERRHAIVAVGKLKPQKNYPTLIKAFSLFVKDFSDYELHIYGDGEEERKLRGLVSCLDLDGKVLFHHYTKQIHKCIKDAYIYVNASDYEGMSNAMLEAMAIGLPSICTDCPIGGARMVIQNNINGVLVPVNDYLSLCDAMKSVASDSSFAARIGKEATKIRERLGVSTIVDMWESIL